MGFIYISITLLLMLMLIVRRNNIDPTESASDADIWRALEQAHLKDHVMNNMGGSLDAEVSEGGSSK